MSDGNGDGIGPIDEKLRNLWRRRSEPLSEAEWHELYTIAVGVLSPTCSDLLSQLPGTRDEYIHDYFLDKVFTLGNKGDEIHHCGALVCYYRRYLLSCLRDPYLKRQATNQSGEADGGSESSPLERELTALASNVDTDPDPAVLRELTDSVAGALGGCVPNAEPMMEATEIRPLIDRYIGVDLGKQCAAALDFLYGRADWEHLADDSWWIRLYLRCHFCPENDDSVALSTLARKYQIPSYHYKAVALGITVPKKTGPAMDAFRGSHRGQWLSRTGIPIGRDYLLEMSLALKVLCLVALKSQDPC